ncbi:MAG TPA: conjugal transfer protein TraF [Vicinamibacterales bacterium]|nr:conjugal transfer protein TraF [Vicinamibacterales bacterium]
MIQIPQTAPRRRFVPMPVRSAAAGIVALAVVLSPALARRAAAQTFETVGVRALGMGGAFVAVADDASATYWNPAGLGTGASFSTLLERTGSDTISNRGTSTAGLDGAQRDTTTNFATAFPALGVSYFRIRQSQLAATADPAGGRQDVGPAGVSSLVTEQFGVTLVQSLVQGVVVGSTLKWVRGTVATAPGIAGESVNQALDRADSLGGRTESAFDLDLGAMASFGPLRLGIVARNVRQPEFQAPDGGAPVQLTRQVRIGAAVAPQLSGQGRLQGLTVAVDADLTRSMTVLGERRHVAAGAEAWLLKRRLGIRGGFRVNTLGQTLPVGTAGLSVALHPGVYVDGEVSRGEDAMARGWGLGARLTF